MLFVPWNEVGPLRLKVVRIALGRSALVVKNVRACLPIRTHDGATYDVGCKPEDVFRNKRGDASVARCHSYTFTVPSTVNVRQRLRYTVINTFCGWAKRAKQATKALEAGYRCICTRAGGGASASPNQYSQLLASVWKVCSGCACESPAPRLWSLLQRRPLTLVAQDVRILAPFPRVK